MILKEIYVEASFTRNLGNFQSFKATAGALLVVEAEDNKSKVFQDGWDMVGDEIQKQLALFDEKGQTKKGLK